MTPLDEASAWPDSHHEKTVIVSLSTVEGDSVQLQVPITVEAAKNLYSRLGEWLDDLGVKP